MPKGPSGLTLTAPESFWVKGQFEMVLCVLIGQNSWERETEDSFSSLCEMAITIFISVLWLSNTNLGTVASAICGTDSALSRMYYAKSKVDTWEISIEIGHAVKQEHLAPGRKGTETRWPLIRHVVDRTLFKDGEVEEMTYTGLSTITVEHRKRRTCLYMNPLTHFCQWPTWYMLSSWG